MIKMYDSTDVSQIPRDAKAVAGYLEGALIPETIGAVRRGWPHAHILSIAVTRHQDADCLDIENGDANPPDAPAWVRRQHTRGLVRPVLYCSLSVVPEVVAACTANGITRGQYLIWAAHYTGVPHIEKGCEGTQYWDKALGRNLDVSLLYDAFFDMIHGRVPKPVPAPVPPAPKPDPKPDPTGPTGYRPANEKRWCAEWDFLPRGERSRKLAVRLWYKLRRRVLTRVMRSKAAEIKAIAAHPQFGGWGKLNRFYRFEQLTKRVGSV